MVAERLTRGPRVDELYVVGLDEVLYQELPIGPHHPEVDHPDHPQPRERDVRQTTDQGRGVGLELRCLAAGVHEYPVVPDHGADRDQPVLVHGKAFGRLLVRATEVGRRSQVAVKVVGPSVIGACHRPADIFRRLNQQRAPVPAHVVNPGDLGPGVANEQDRLASDRDRHHVPGLCQLVREADEGPGILEHPGALELEDRLAGIGHRRQAGQYRPAFAERG